MEELPLLLLLMFVLDKDDCWTEDDTRGVIHGPGFCPCIDLWVHVSRAYSSARYI